MQKSSPAPWLCEYLEKNGYKVKKGVGGPAHRFSGGNTGRANPAVGFPRGNTMRLRKIGHGCGHNLIATCTMAAALGARRRRRRTGWENYRLRHSR